MADPKRRQGHRVPVIVSGAIVLLVLTSCGVTRPSARLLAIESLPRAPLDPAVLTAVCDPDASQSDPRAGETVLYCGDGLVLGLRAISAVVAVPIERLYLDRPTCRNIACTPDELSTATVTGHWQGGQVSVALDSRLTTVRIPTADPALAWPTGGSATAPPQARPAIEDAPREVEDRAPYPFCGTADLAGDLNPSAFECFRVAVLAGRAAEMVFDVYSAEGDPITWLYRFSGRGALVRYSREPVGWSRQAGTLILGVTSTAWDFAPWYGTDTSIP